MNTPLAQTETITNETTVSFEISGGVAPQLSYSTQGGGPSRSVGELLVDDITRDAIERVSASVINTNKDISVLVAIKVDTVTQEPFTLAPSESVHKDYDVGSKIAIVVTALPDGGRHDPTFYIRRSKGNDEPAGG